MTAKQKWPLGLLVYVLLPPLIICGMLAVLALAIFMGSDNDAGTSKNVNRFDRGLIAKVGFDGQQEFKVIRADYKSVPFMDDYEGEICYQLTDVKNERDDWTSSDETAAYEKIASTTRHFPHGTESSCFVSQSQMILVIKERPSSSGGLAGQKVFIFDPKSKRLFFKGWRV